MAESLMLALYNVRGLHDNAKRRKLFNYVNMKYDITFMQETHSTKNVEKYWKNEFGGKIYYAHGEANARGVMIPFRKGVEVKIHDILRDINGRYIIIKV